MEKLNEIYVEKMDGFDTEARGFSTELRELGLLAGTVRVVNRYIVMGMKSEDFEDSIYKVFADRNGDRIYHALSEVASHGSILITELLPGQFDIRANAAEECIQLIYGNFEAKVRFQRILLFSQMLSESTLASIKKTLINPVEMREGALDVSFRTEQKIETQPEIFHGFARLNDEELRRFHEKRNFAMTWADLACVRDYFCAEGRDPNETELKVLDTYWSDHCRHTTFNTELTEFKFNEEGPEKRTYDLYRALRNELGREKRPQTLMDLATIGTKVLRKQGYVNDLDESEEINACSIIREIRTEKGREPYLIQFKNETHNHPTEIEPFGGAATCLGGAIRDPLAGRAFVYQAMRVTGAGDPSGNGTQTLPGKLPQRKICQQAARGYSSYGNQIGLAAGIVHEIYHPGYVAKRMEVGAVIGSAPLDSVRRSIPVKGDQILLVGGRTGRDGVGGATGSSKSHDVQSLETSGSEVQKGNAPTERKLQRLIRNDRARQLIKRCNDFGAGGVSVAVGELADSLIIDLDKVTLKYQGLTATETAVSESQERMAMVIAPENLAEFRQYLDEENLEGTVIAEVTDSGRLVMKWRGKEAVDLKRSFLDSAGAKVSQSVLVEENGQRPVSQILPVTRENILNQLLELNSQSQKSLHENFDSTNGAATLTLPFGGTRQRTESSHMAALIPAGDTVSQDASVMTYGFDPFLSEQDPYRGAYLAVTESVAKMAASGAGIEKTRLSFQEYFQKLGQDPALWGKPVKSLLGALQAQLDYHTPSIGGKDSMSGTFDDIHVPPTLISFAVNTMAGEKVIGNDLKGNGVLYTIETPDQSGLPDSEFLLKAAALIETANEESLIYSCDTSARGSIMTLMNMAWGNGCGLEVQLTGNAFARRPQDFILEIPKVAIEKFESLASEAGVPIRKIGVSSDSGNMIFNEISLSHEETWEIANQKISPVYKRNISETMPVESLNFSKAPLILPSGLLKSVPKALIPVFPGSNCEYDLARAFNNAGAQASIFVFRNRDQEDLRNSIAELAKAIRDSQIVVLPGGFSAGDEPDGSGKFIANVFRNPLAESAMSDLLDNRSGLVIGICNGFQALVRLGLLPNGHISEPSADLPALTVNSIGRHHDSIVRVRVSSNASPWLRYVKPGEIYSVPVSHGEGRFMASDRVIKELVENGQIITQYCDEKGNATMAAPDNPNGSQLAIEGIISPDGRVLGKMGHNERWQEGLFRNYSGQFDMKLFQAGVDFFTK